MLTPLDDTLCHQLPTTFDHVWTSDPRWFDRYWFAIYSQEGNVAIQVTMGAYRNMNVLDGGAVMIVDNKQYNVRVSRSLGSSVSGCTLPRYSSVLAWHAAAGPTSL